MKQHSSSAISEAKNFPPPPQVRGPPPTRGMRTSVPSVPIPAPLNVRNLPPPSAAMQNRPPPPNRSPRSPH